MKEMLVACAEATDAFAKRLDALDSFVAEGKKSVHFTVVTRLSKIEFVYTIKGMGLLCPKSTLFARLYPQKNQSFYLHLQELMEDTDFRCTYFSFIESAQRMNDCFATLAGMVEEYLPKLETLALDDEAYNATLARKRQAIIEFASIKAETIPTDPDEQEAFWSDWSDFYELYAHLAYFTNYIGYTAFLSGNFEKARHIYQKREKKGNLNAFEQRLFAFLNDSQSRDYQPLPPSCAPILENQVYINGVDEGKLLLLTGGICYGVALAVVWLIIGLVYLFCCTGTVFYPIDWFFAFILPLLPAIFGSVGLRRFFVPLAFKDKKDVDRIRNIDRLSNGKVTVVAWVLTGLLTLAFLFFALIFTLATPRFFADHMIYDDAAAFPFPHAEAYQYEDIERVCYIKGRWNAYDELVNRPSYVLFFKDGRCIDLDGVITEQQTVEHVLPLLTPYTNGNVETFDSDKELVQTYDLSQSVQIIW